MKPVAVLISDIHFTVPTLQLATQALIQAQTTASTLDIPLVVAGDTLDTKAIIRGECANSLIDIFSSEKDIQTFVLVGNHDLINEKSKSHSLNFLTPYVTVIDKPTIIREKLYLIPYISNIEDFKTTLSSIPKKSTIIMHQGIRGADMGHYVQDRSSISPEFFKDYRIISGHYHKKQDIQCGPIKANNIGLFSYIGNPYTLTFGEANDGPKGYQILFEDGSLEFVPTDLRKHVIIERDIKNLYDEVTGINPDDLIWLKVTGPKSELAKIKKKKIGESLFGHQNFKLDLIPTKAEAIKDAEKLQNTAPIDILDSLIDNLQESKEQKDILKRLWREVISESS